ncbi:MULTISPECIES: Nramp family divalent metal transporter [Curtobacterium]|jgi:manganese transport protein|uniref:Nramp family divalent metal transporter n=2 Tax=Curtobacterium TaxID=2034 RepID=A0A9Q2W7F6_9MICO|nr:MULTISPECIES: Nramp family divalent metal transporter [Curtobacterium]EYT66983.1 manganese transporter [Curtobacterium flaccumfaciens UCD-AKU]KIQ11867.1 manganese transporter [Curtobacterium flaccumfaciens]KQR27567.1 manganese transporter [Curtobacterium sp. Leaf154]MBF4598328.1 Nramp family divalent metal transporter [Curtobacterium sp. VKM Ac-1796]MBF4610423.1 Nramp family divalent metal transporter [Curtobacterium sp. VKM Ac-2889]
MTDTASTRLDERPPGAPRRRAAGLTLLGPAFVAAIAYVDPGNVAANLTAGAEYGYLLLWVLVAANASAVVVQYLSAKLGVVTGKSLPEHLGLRMRRAPRLLFWGQAEIVAAATDIAEVIGGALALYLLFDLPLVVGGIITGLVSMLLLTLHSRRGTRLFETVVTAMLAILTVGFCAGLLFARVTPADLVAGLVPRFEGAGSVLLAASMLGATVMPHAVYLHSALARDRHGDVPAGPERRRVLVATRWDVGLALIVAGGVNIAMLVLAAATLPGVAGTDSIPGAQRAIAENVGPVVGVLFAVGLLASGLASTSVGCMAGAEIMQGLLHVRIPLVARRAITLVPAIVLLALHIDATMLLVVSQVVLSFGIAFAIVPLVVYTSRRSVMGTDVNAAITRVVAWVIAAVIVALNIALVVLTLTG